MIDAFVFIECCSLTQNYVTKSVDIMSPMLGDRDLSVVSAAVYALGHRKDRHAIGPLSQLTDRPEAMIHRGLTFFLDGLPPIPMMMFTIGQPLGWGL
jgi:hypothetical protein